MLKLYKLTLFHLLNIKNGAYQYNQLTSYIVDTHPVYVVAISSQYIFFCDLNFLFEYFKIS